MTMLRGEGSENWEKVGAAGIQKDGIEGQKAEK